MVEILLKTNELITFEKTSEIPIQDLEFHIMQFIDYNDSDLNWAKENYGIDFSIMKQFEDIEISSHFLDDEHQISFHISLPYYNEEKKLVEEPIFFIISSNGFFLFSSAGIDHYINKIYKYKTPPHQKIKNTTDILKFQVEFIADYYADIIESETKKVKSLASTILLEKKFSSEVMDLITRYNFNNLLIKESLMETIRVFNLYKRSSWKERSKIRETIESELSDLTVVSDYIQFNFDRLDNLNENVSNKIDLEQNYIFKMLTVATVCISLPTLIAGVYGMNFENMPELSIPYGYPATIAVMVLAAILPFRYFKRKKWL